MHRREYRPDNGYPRVSAIPNRIVVLLAGSLLLLGGCQSRTERELARTQAAIRDGSIKAALQRHFDTHRQCASVLGASAGGRLKAAPDDPVAGALREAGLIVPVEAPGSWRPAADAARWFEPAYAMPADMVRLCYAKRAIGRVLLDVESGNIRYTYRMVDFAPWTRLPAVRRAVPALTAVSTGLELPGAEGVPVRDGQVQLDGLRETALDPVLFEFGMDFVRGGDIAEVAAISSPTGDLNGGGHSDGL